MASPGPALSHRSLGNRRADRQRRADQPPPDRGCCREEPRPRQQPFAPLTAGLALLERELRAAVDDALRGDPHLDAIAVGAGAWRAHRERCAVQPAPNIRLRREESRPRQHPLAPAAIGLALLERELNAVVRQALRGDAHLGVGARALGGGRGETQRGQQCDDDRCCQACVHALLRSRGQPARVLYTGDYYRSNDDSMTWWCWSTVREGFWARSSRGDHALMGVAGHRRQLIGTGRPSR